MKPLKLFYWYSRDFLLFAALITLLTFFLLHQVGTSALTALIWFKLATSIAGIFIHQQRKSKEIFFYMNLGLGEKELMGFSLVADLGIWLAGIILLIKAVIANGGVN